MEKGNRVSDEKQRELMSYRVMEGDGGKGERKRKGSGLHFKDSNRALIMIYGLLRVLI